MGHSRSAQPTIDPEEAPFFALLERLGRRVLRPGGRDATRRLLEGLGVGAGDDVVELAAEVGATASEVLSRRPRSYTAVEPNPDFAPRLVEVLDAGSAQRVAAAAQATGLADASADVVIGEAMLTMQTDPERSAIVGEPMRLLRPGGRYGIHELATLTDEPGRIRDLQRELSQAVRVGARPSGACSPTRGCEARRACSPVSCAGLRLEPACVGHVAYIAGTGRCSPRSRASPRSGSGRFRPVLLRGPESSSAASLWSAGGGRYSHTSDVSNSRALEMGAANGDRESTCGDGLERNAGRRAGRGARRQRCDRRVAGDVGGTNASA